MCLKTEGEQITHNFCKYGMAERNPTSLIHSYLREYGERETKFSAIFMDIPCLEHVHAKLKFNYKLEQHASNL